MKTLNTRWRFIALVPLLTIAILSIGNRIGAAGKEDDFRFVFKGEDTAPTTEDNAACWARSGDFGFPPPSAAPCSSPSPTPIFPIEKPDIPVGRPDLASHLGDETALARTNFALASNGAVASASSSYPGSAPSGAIDGDRKGLNPGKDGYWTSKDGTSPQWLEVDFSGYKTITEIDQFTMQDDYASPVEPYPTMEFKTYGLTGFDVYGWIESGWAPLPWSRRGNKLVWSQLELSTSPITVSKIRVKCVGSPDSYSRIAELEAWGKPGAKK